MIAVPIVASTLKEALEDMRKASKFADTIELRLDSIKKPNLESLLAKRIKPIIVTARKRGEGGKSTIKEEERIEMLEKAIALKADFIDVELSTNKGLLKRILKKARKGKTNVIVSFHNLKRTDKKEILRKYNEIKKIKPDIIKIATFANSINDNIAIFELIKRAKKEGKRIIALCMGEKGEISRILSPLFGSYLTFASLKKGKESASGQIDVKTLKNIYRICRLKNPKILGLVGNPVSHSKGYIFHNNGFKKLGLNSIYVNFLVDDLASFIKNYKPIINGLSITIPFKTEVIRHLDRIEPVAKRIGAVNTVIKKDGKLIGYNTDTLGAIKSLQSKNTIKGKNVLMIGAGGAARAIGYGIVNKKGKLTIANRTLSKAKKLAKELKCRAMGLSHIDGLRNMCIIINATSIGMFPKTNKTPIEKGILRKISSKKTVVFDTVYSPKNTKLLKDAKNLGLNTVNGYKMFIAQAEEQFNLFTGRELK